MLGFIGHIVAVFLVLSFGWVGAPGEYMAYAWACKEFVDGHAPACPEWHDIVPLHVHVLMDDEIIIEPLLGVRPWISARTVEKGARLLFGPLAINDEKKEEEGQCPPMVR